MTPAPVHTAHPSPVAAPSFEFAPCTCDDRAALAAALACRLTRSALFSSVPPGEAAALVPQWLAEQRGVQITMARCGVSGARIGVVRRQTAASGRSRREADSISYLVFEAFRGLGLATGMLAGWLASCSDTAFSAVVRDDNFASRRVVEGNGFGFRSLQPLPYGLPSMRHYHRPASIERSGPQMAPAQASTLLTALGDAVARGRGRRARSPRIEQLERDQKQGGSRESLQVEGYQTREGIR